MNFDCIAMDVILRALVNLVTIVFMIELGRGMEGPENHNDPKMTVLSRQCERILSTQTPFDLVELMISENERMDGISTGRPINKSSSPKKIEKCSN